MRNSIPYRARKEDKADKSTLGLLIVLIIAVFVALTFGEAEGVKHIFGQSSVFPISSL